MPLSGPSKFVLQILDSSSQDELAPLYTPFEEQPSGEHLWGAGGHGYMAGTTGGWWLVWCVCLDGVEGGLGWSAANIGLVSLPVVAGTLLTGATVIAKTRDVAMAL